jgi:hypothetical protein
VQILDAVVDEVDHLLGADGGGDEAAGRGIVFEAVEPLGEPARDAGPRTAGEIGRLFEVLHRKDPGRDRDRQPGRASDVEKAEVDAVVEEELGGCPVAPAATFRFKTSMSCKSVGLCARFSERSQSTPRIWLNSFRLSLLLSTDKAGLQTVK